VCDFGSVINNASAAIGIKHLWKTLKAQFTVLTDELDGFFEDVEIEAEVAEKAAAAKAREEAEAHAQRRLPYLDYCYFTQPSVRRFSPSPRSRIPFGSI
jgi:hypothetical protein